MQLSTLSISHHEIDRSNRTTKFHAIKHIPGSWNDVSFLRRGMTYTESGQNCMCRRPIDRYVRQDCSRGRWWIFVEDVTAGMSRSGRLEELEVSSFQLAVQGVEMREALGVCPLPLHEEEGASSRSVPEVLEPQDVVKGKELPSVY